LVRPDAPHTKGPLKFQEVLATVCPSKSRKMVAEAEGRLFRIGTCAFETTELNKIRVIRPDLYKFFINKEDFSFSIGTQRIIGYD
jgi:hypothetical protein